MIIGLAAAWPVPPPPNIQAFIPQDFLFMMLAYYCTLL